jgi:hypothetical protein
MTDGTLRRTFVTSRRPMTTIEPDGYHSRPYWEND